MASAWRIAVAGGSLGGLSAALVLRDLGADVTVYERSPAELEQRGAGIGFLPASSRYLVERAGLDIREHHLHPVLGEVPTHGEADPVGPARHDRDLALDLPHGARLLTLGTSNGGTR